jgi:hypothetical protein
MGAGSGAGNTISNVIDYSKWLRELLTHTSPSTLSSKSSSNFSPKGLKHPRIQNIDFKELLKARTLVPEDGLPTPFKGPQAYALGWFTGNYRGYEWFEHSGGLDAFATEVSKL